MRLFPGLTLLPFLLVGPASEAQARGRAARAAGGDERPRLVLIRHGESEANLKYMWTGQADSPLTARGRAQPFAAGQSLRGIRFGRVYSSPLGRAAKTARGMLVGAGQAGVPVILVKALLERRAGALRGQTLPTILERFGHETVQRWRMTWDGKMPDGPIEKGESMREISQRLGPFLDRRVMRDLRAGLNVGLASHKDTLRALIGRIEGLDDAGLAALDVPNATPIIYRLEPDGRLVREP